MAERKRNRRNYNQRYNTPLSIKVRKECGSAIKLSEKLGWSSAKVHRIVSGKQPATVQEAFEICAAINVTTMREMHDLFC